MAPNWANWEDILHMVFHGDDNWAPLNTNSCQFTHQMMEGVFLCVCAANVFPALDRCVQCFSVLLRSTHIAAILLVATGCNPEWWKDFRNFANTPLSHNYSYWCSWPQILPSLSSILTSTTFFPFFGAQDTRVVLPSSASSWESAAPACAKWKELSHRMLQPGSLRWVSCWCTGPGAGNWEAGPGAG